MEGRRETPRGRLVRYPGTPRISRKGEGVRYPGWACHATKVGGGVQTGSFLGFSRQGGWAAIAPAFRRRRWEREWSWARGSDRGRLEKETKGRGQLRQRLFGPQVVYYLR